MAEQGGVTPPGDYCTRRGARGRTGSTRHEIARPSHAARAWARGRCTHPQRACSCHDRTREYAIDGPSAHPPPRLGPARRDRRVRHPRCGRQGQGAARGRPAGDRFRGGRTGLPHATARGGGRGGSVPRPCQPPLLPRRRPSRPARGDCPGHAAGQRLRDRPDLGAGDERRQAGGLPGLRRRGRSRRRGAAARPLLDHLSRGHPAGRRRARGGVRRHRGQLSGERGPARGGPDPADPRAAAELPLQPHGGGLLTGADRGDRCLGTAARHLGDHR